MTNFFYYLYYTVIQLNIIKYNVKTTFFSFQTTFWVSKNGSIFQIFPHY